MKFLLDLMEKRNGNRELVKQEIDKDIDLMKGRLEELEKMSEEKFMRMVSESVFGVASKEYYIGNVEQQIGRLEKLKSDVDYYFHDIFKENLPTDYILKDKFKGNLKQLKRVLPLVQNGNLKDFIFHNKK